MPTAIFGLTIPSFAMHRPDSLSSTSRRGFTLAEILVVLILIALMTGQLRSPPDPNVRSDEETVERPRPA